MYISKSDINTKGISWSVVEIFFVWKDVSLKLMSFSLFVPVPKLKKKAKKQIAFFQECENCVLKKLITKNSYGQEE